MNTKTKTDLLIITTATECAATAWAQADPTDPQLCPGDEPQAGDWDALKEALECEPTLEQSDFFAASYAEAVHDLDPRIADYTDTAIEQGVVEFTAHGERYQYRDRGAGVWARFEWDADNFGGGCFVHTGTIAAPSDATPQQLDRA